MKTINILGYMWQDLLSPRSRQEIVIGSLAIIITTVAMLLLFAFSQTVEKIVNKSLDDARPILGVIEVVHQKRGKFLQTEQIQYLNSLKETSLISEISYLSKNILANEINIWSSKEERIPFIQAWFIDYKDAILNPEYGFKILYGKGLIKNNQDWNFQLVANKRFLQEQIGWSKEEIDQRIKNKNLSIRVSFLAPVKIQHPNNPRLSKQYDLPDRYIPISGIVDVQDAFYPDIFLNKDILKAYTNFNDWHPSYPLQFKDQENNPLIIDCKVTIVSQQTQEKQLLCNQDNINHTLFNYQTLPDSPEDIANEKIYYNRALLWLQDYKSLKKRQELTKKIENTNIQLKLRPLDYTLTKSLTRIIPMVESFRLFSISIMFTLITIIIMLFGYGFVMKKRGDIGLLRATGLSSYNIAILFNGQLIILTITSLLIGFLLAWMASYGLESLALDFIRKMINPEDLAKVSNNISYISIKIDSISIALTSLLIFIATLLGSIFPTTQAVTVNPIEQLQTKI